MKNKITILLLVITGLIQNRLLANEPIIKLINRHNGLSIKQAFDPFKYNTSLSKTDYAIGYRKINKFDIGIGGGPSLIGLHESREPTLFFPFSNSEFKSNRGFASSVFFQFNLNNTISIHTNLNFERKGASLTTNVYDSLGYNGANGTILLGVLTTNLNLNYLTLPVLLRASWGRRTKFFMNFGPYFSCLIKQSHVNGDFNIPANATIDRWINASKFDIGLTTGIGISIPIERDFYIAVELRENHGLHDVSENSQNQNYSANIQTYSDILLFSIGYKFGQREAD